jgi:hypothetical protein
VKPFIFCFKVSFAGNGFRPVTTSIEIPCDSGERTGIEVADAAVPVRRVAPPMRTVSLLRIPLKKSFLLAIWRSSEPIGYVVG